MMSVKSRLIFLYFIATWAAIIGVPTKLVQYPRTDGAKLKETKRFWEQLSGQLEKPGNSLLGALGQHVSNSLEKTVNSVVQSIGHQLSEALLAPKDGPNEQVDDDDKHSVKPDFVETVGHLFGGQDADSMKTFHYLQSLVNTLTKRNEDLNEEIRRDAKKSAPETFPNNSRNITLHRLVGKHY